ncbi:hypothetical protein CE143_11935 [Photorhabdus luminescens]|nr:hypothetical protein CE143_11935 [Photorhabdus luminescens]
MKGKDYINKPLSLNNYNSFFSNFIERILFKKIDILQTLISPKVHIEKLIIIRLQIKGKIIN